MTENKGSASPRCHIKCSIQCFDQNIDMQKILKSQVTGLFSRYTFIKLTNSVKPYIYIYIYIYNRQAILITFKGITHQHLPQEQHSKINFSDLGVFNFRQKDKY